MIVFYWLYCVECARLYRGCRCNRLFIFLVFVYLLITLGLSLSKFLPRYSFNLGTYNTLQSILVFVYVLISLGLSLSKFLPRNSFSLGTYNTLQSKLSPLVIFRVGASVRSFGLSRSKFSPLVSICHNRSKRYS